MTRRTDDESNILEMWTVYKHPRDFPNEYVVRRWEIKAGVETPTSEMYLAGSLEEIRKVIPKGLVRLSRHENDEPPIVETWI